MSQHRNLTNYVSFFRWRLPVGGFTGAVFLLENGSSSSSEETDVAFLLDEQMLAVSSWVAFTGPGLAAATVVVGFSTECVG